MANTFAPFGFRQYRGLGSAPTYEQSVRAVASTNSTPIYFGDPVMNLNTGYVAVYVGDDGNGVSGVFAGCKYLSVSQKRTVWSNWWPGADANGDVEAYIIDDPNAQFLVQVSGGPITLGNIGNYIDALNDGGNSNTGISGFYATLPAVNPILPFRIIGLVTQPPGANGTDITSANNDIIVAFNNVTSRSNAAGPTGI